MTFIYFMLQQILQSFNPRNHGSDKWHALRGAGFGGCVFCYQRLTPLGSFGVCIAGGAKTKQMSMVRPRLSRGYLFISCYDDKESNKFNQSLWFYRRVLKQWWFGLTLSLSKGEGMWDDILFGHISYKTLSFSKGLCAAKGYSPWHLCNLLSMIG